MGTMVEFTWKSEHGVDGRKTHGSTQFFDFTYNKQPDDYLNLYIVNEDGYFTNTLLSGEFAEAKLLIVLVDNPLEFIPISNPQVLRYGPPMFDEPNIDYAKDIQTVLIIKKDGMEIALDLNEIEAFEFTVKEGSRSDMTHTIFYRKQYGSADIT